MSYEPATGSLHELEINPNTETRIYYLQLSRVKLSFCVAGIRISPEQNTAAINDISRMTFMLLIHFN